MYRPPLSSTTRANWRLSSMAVLVGTLFAPLTQAASFEIDNGVTQTTTQTLNDHETGVIKAGGAIQTTSGRAIDAVGDNVMIRNDGSITTSGDNHYGVYSTGANATITSSGSITTSGYGGYGIYSNGGANATITNSGSITTSGLASFGIVSTSANATITNSGSITTSEQNGYGISSSGANAAITNSGSITISGVGSVGIRSSGANTTITNSGSITTSGQNGYGIYSTGANATITNSGSITTSGESGNGIYSNGADATITNSGAITTSGQAGYGIYSGDANATITNSGAITTSGQYGHGIASTGADATITNSGSITTSGLAGYGIFSYAANATITNNGSITTSGEGGYGIISVGDNATITHSGSISVTGLNSVGIHSSGTDSILNLSGRVSATGAATQAIELWDSGSTLNLHSGATIVGSIDMHGNRVNVDLEGGGPSATMSLTNPGTIHQSGRGLSFVSGNTVSLVDTTNLTANQAALGSASMNQFGAVNQQLDQAAPPPPPIKVAASELTSGMLHQDQGPTAWGHAFGHEDRREASAAALGYRDDGYGLIGGYEQTLGEHRVGVFGGLSRGTVKADSHSAQTDNDSVFVGLYGQYVVDGWNLNGALALGHVNADNERRVVDNVYGEQTAKSSNHTTYLSPSIAVTRPIDLGAGISLRPSAQLNYTYGRVSGYTENGTTRSNLSVGSHDASVLNTRLQVALRQTFAEHQGEFEMRWGVTRSDFGSDQVKINLQGGAATHYGLTGADSISGGFVGVGGRLTLKNKLSLVGDVEYTQGSGDNHAAVGYLGLAYQY